MPRPTFQQLRNAAREAGGKLESDGDGGWNLLAPPGSRWGRTETQAALIPLGDADDDEDEADMIQYGIDCCVAGHEPIRGG